MNDLEHETFTVQRWSPSSVFASDRGGFVAYGDYLELVRRQREAERLCATVNTCIDALRKIQARCAGEAMPNWENTERTGASRSWILDRTNWALAVCDAAMGEPK